MINRPLLAAINHLLEAETWARERLRPHQDKSAIIRVAAFEFHCVILASGLIAEPPEAETAFEPTLEVRLAPASLLDALRGGESALKSAEIRGDADFATAVLFLVKNLRWDFEDDLSRLIGDIAAHRLVSEARNLLAWERDARMRLAASLGEYLTREGEILAEHSAVEGFVTEVDRMRDDVARLEKRLQRISAGRGSGKSHTRR